MKVASLSSSSFFLSALLVLLGAAVLPYTTKADEDCNVNVFNYAYDGLTVNSYDGTDGVCWVYSYSTPISNNSMAMFPCGGSSCKMKVAGSNTCYGTQEVDCNMYLIYYLNTLGELTFCVSNSQYCESSSSGRRQLLGVPTNEQLVVPEQVVQAPEPPKAKAQRWLRSSAL